MKYYLKSGIGLGYRWWSLHSSSVDMWAKERHGKALGMHLPI